MNLAADNKSASVIGDADVRDAIGSSMLERVATVNSGSVNQGLLIQLRSHHPTGCLLSELLQIVDNNYVVRAMVVVDGATIASAMSAASNLELAEDQAFARVVAVVGLTPLNLSDVRNRAVAKSESPLKSSAAQSIEPQSVEPVAPLEPSTSRIPDIASAPVAVEPLEENLDPPLEVASSTATVTKSPAKSAKSTKSKAKSTKTKSVAKATVPAPPELVEESVSSVEMTGGAEDVPVEMEYEFTMDGEVLDSSASPTEPDAMADVPPPPNEPTIDLSDAIAQIGTEIERIGWTKKQGSAYLQETYGKRTRAQLTEDELLSFLHYLKALPSKVQPVLNDLPF